MDNEKIQELLLQLIQDVMYIRTKLDAIEQQRLGARIDSLEAMNKEHDRVIKSLENRATTIEEFTRNSMVEARKQTTSLYISVGLAFFSALLSFLFNMIM